MCILFLTLQPILKKGLLKPHDIYVIPFRGLSAGVHSYQWEINGSFFEADEYSDILVASVEVSLLLDKSDRLMKLDFTAQGELTIPCDRCMAPLEVDVDCERTIIARETSSDEEGDDDLIFLNSHDYQLDVAEWIREMILLSLPMRNVHEDNECDPEVLAQLEKMREGGNKPFDETKI